MNADDARRVLRWYPRGWRRRYGDELVALLEYMYSDQPLSGRCRISLYRSGTIERIREMRRRFSNYLHGLQHWLRDRLGRHLGRVSSAADATTRHTFVLVCGGWVIGWLSATIARAVYPLPKRRTGP